MGCPKLLCVAVLFSLIAIPRMSQGSECDNFHSWFQPLPNQVIHVGPFSDVTCTVKLHCPTCSPTQTWYSYESILDKVGNVIVIEENVHAGPGISYADVTADDQDTPTGVYEFTTEPNYFCLERMWFAVKRNTAGE